MPGAFFTRIENVFSGKDSKGSGRTEIWAVGVAALERFGFVGAGFSNFTAVYDRYVVRAGPTGYAYGSHNTYLGTWVELGVIGLAFMLGAVISYLWISLWVHRM